MFSKRKGISYFKLAGTNYKYLHIDKRSKKKKNQLHVHHRCLVPLYFLFHLLQKQNMTRIAEIRI